MWRSFQLRCRDWLVHTFGEPTAENLPERTHRFVEEAIELAQSVGCSKGDVLTLVDYVYSRPEGERYQEAGGVMLTLASLCSCARIDMINAGEAELARAWTKVEDIRAKQATKPTHSPLPGKSQAEIDAAWRRSTDMIGR